MKKCKAIVAELQPLLEELNSTLFAYELAEQNFKDKFFQVKINQDWYEEKSYRDSYYFTQGQIEVVRLMIDRVSNLIKKHN